MAGERAAINDAQNRITLPGKVSPGARNWVKDSDYSIGKPRQDGETPRNPRASLGISEIPLLFQGRGVSGVNVAKPGHMYLCTGGPVL